MNDTRPTLGTLIDQIAAQSDDALEQLGQAVRTAADLSSVGDQLVGHFVDIARASGASWAQIGQYLGGVSKQAAQQRFSPDFSRFTERARKAVVDTQSIAEEHRHNYMGTEHVLVALCGDPDSIAAKALVALAGPLERVRDEAVGRFGPPSAPTQGKPRFTLKAKAALANTMREALGLGHNYIGTEHLLLGQRAEPQQDPSVAYEVLHGCGITYDAARTAIVDQFARLRG